MNNYQLEKFFSFFHPILGCACNCNLQSEMIQRFQNNFHRATTSSPCGMMHYIHWNLCLSTVCGTIATFSTRHKCCLLHSSNSLASEVLDILENLWHLHTFLVNLLGFKYPLLFLLLHLFVTFLVCEWPLLVKKRFCNDFIVKVRN